MKFIDEATITIESGKGGNGCVGFRREKYIPKGGPDGGDGGRGGSVYIRARGNMTTLLDFREKHFYKAENGQPGRGSQCSGRAGKDLTIDVPVGTKVMLAGTDHCLVDLTEDMQEFCLAHGGAGGLGNIHFKSSRNQTPYQSTPGEPAQRKDLKLELQVMADCGLLGLPNAGKSSLIRQLSRAQPKVADYPFTTVRPHLGIMVLPYGQRVVLADIPGLLAGAHTGHGMGNVFLRHLSRCKALIEVLDGAGCDGVDLCQAHSVLEQELAAYQHDFAHKRRILVINKADLGVPEEEINKLRQKLSGDVVGPIVVSCLTGQGLDKLKDELAKEFGLD